MKALSIKQPWAWAIMAGHKTIENRTWKTPYRGRILIHAGKTFDPTAGETFARAGCLSPPALPCGVILGTVVLIDVVPVAQLSDDPWACGPWCFMLERPQLFREPIPYAGRLTLFEVPESALVVAPDPAQLF